MMAQERSAPHARDSKFSPESKALLVLEMLTEFNSSARTRTAGKTPMISGPLLFCVINDFLFWDGRHAPPSG